jgi:hypothetical protein
VTGITEDVPFPGAAPGVDVPQELPAIGHDRLRAADAVVGHDLLVLAVPVVPRADEVVHERHRG